MFKILPRLFLASTILFTTASAQEPAFDGQWRAVANGLQEAYLPVIAPSSHAANLLRLRNGDLLCFWFTGEWEGKSGVGIAVSRLDHGSKSWSKPILIDKRDGASFQNPVPFEAPDGTVWLFHTTQPADQGQKNARVLVVKSHDLGRTWSAPAMLFDVPGAFVRQPLVIQPNGTWLLPMYFTPSAGITDEAESNYSVVKLSQDSGKTWKECPIPHSNGYVQPSVLMLAPNRYVMFFRSRFADHIFRSTSSDGCTWTAPKATSLPNNNSSIQATLLKDGKIAIAFNNTHADVVNGKPTTGARVPLSVALSADGGETWSALRNVETGRPVPANDPTYADLMKKEPEREEYSYPSILQLQDGKIVVAYTFRRKGMKVVEFSEDWLAKGAAPVAK